MIKREKITLVFFLLLSIFFCIESVRLEVGSVHSPGPGFLTFWVGIILILLVIILVLKEKGKRIVGQVEPFFRGKNVRNVIYGNIFLFAYGLLFEKIGFVLCAALFIGSCCRYFDLAANDFSHFFAYFCHHHALGDLLWSSVFIAWVTEKRISKHPERSGKWEIRGVASPEAANNAGVTSPYIPMLALAIPPTATMAVMLGALMMYGVNPGPLLIQESPDIFWGTVTSMYTRNA